MKYYEGKEVKILYVDGICTHENAASTKRDRRCARRACVLIHM